MSDTVRVKFIREGRVDGKLVFHVGEVYGFSVESGSAERWIKRGIAIEALEQEAGYDPSGKDPLVVDVLNNEEFNEPEDLKAIEELEKVEIEKADALAEAELDVLGGESETVAKSEVKVENKKGKTTKKGN